MKWAYLFWQWLQKELPVGSLTLKPSAYSTTYNMTVMHEENAVGLVET